MKSNENKFFSLIKIFDNIFIQKSSLSGTHIFNLDYSGLRILIGQRLNLRKVCEGRKLSVKHPSRVCRVKRYKNRTGEEKRLTVFAC